MSTSPDAVLVPLQLEAFVLNQAVCGDEGDKGARIIPITQPNYTFLRLDNFLIQPDLQRHADLHNSAPAEKNTRLTDVSQKPPAPRCNRHGVYLHWILPRAYRAGPTTAYRQPPTRWIVIRKIVLDSIKPIQATGKFAEYEAWVIESDYLWKLDDIPLSYDIQVDVSPFVKDIREGEGQSKDYITQQAEVFIGKKTPLKDWGKSCPHGCSCCTPSDSAYTDISLLRSGNPLFADFQMHNSNVFSMLDNFEYQDDLGHTQYLDSASSSYYLFGWHSSTDTDPFHDSTGGVTHSEKLESLFTYLADSGIPDVTNPWLESSGPMRLCCHGALYNVNWNNKSKPNSVPADEFAARIQNNDVPAVSVGTTPMDALMTYCSSRVGEEPNDAVEKLEEDLLAIESLLHARDDGVEGQREAKDIVYNWNFARAAGGVRYFLKSDNGPDGESDDGPNPTQPPDPAVLEMLDDLNRVQALLDGCQRALRQYRWDMFSCWWKYVSDVSNKERGDQDPRFKKESQDISARVTALQDQVGNLAEQAKYLVEDIQQMAVGMDAKTGTMPFFYRARDPTILLAGIPSGWPLDFNDPTQVRIPSQTTGQDAKLPDALASLLKMMKPVIGVDELQTAAENLCKEFVGLEADTDHSPADKTDNGEAYPQFHDNNTPDKRRRDQWGGRQPWFPLFTEWEIEYTHVPFEYWSLDKQTARLSTNKMVRYGVEVPGGAALYDALGPADKHDTCILSGRSLVLPQASFSLEAKLTQLFQDTPSEILDPIITPEERARVLNNLGALAYLSYPLTGLTDGLLTLSQGSHIKPEILRVGSNGQTQVDVVEAAVFDKAGFSENNLLLVGGNSAMTPFATHKRFTSRDYCPFKPVTHGQFKFTKLNVIDKFGQALVAIDPKPRKEGPPPLYPCISDFYEPQVFTDADGKTYANTVVQDDVNQCEFIQLPPQINQYARLNAVFVKPSTTKGDNYWCPVGDWDNPVWGWVVVNYPDHGIQLFLQDGSFYREVRYGGPKGTDAGPKWEPFAPDKSQTGSEAQLDLLIERLQDPNYLKGFWAMISEAMDSKSPAPDSYSQFLASITGRPLALANMGWSLELDGPPLLNQSTAAEVSKPNKALLDYSFQVKLGDGEREYDGLVGYFDAERNPSSGNELNLNYINTYFGGGDDPTKVPKNLHMLSSDSYPYPSFKPFWVPPFPESAPYDKNVITEEQYAEERYKNLRVFGAILDPFTAVHGYSSILPACSLKLPTWTWQEPMNNMTAFFHAGPLTLTKDAPLYRKENKLTTENMKNDPAANLSLPALTVGDWNWLQPYPDPDANDPSNASLPVYNAYGIEKTGNILRPGFERGPYTAVEGFLQLRRPVNAGKQNEKRKI
ncbi:hypothetical protein TWF718_005792 [Orbilia javanica]|uniref:Uncharacterized protein n=1 Tax=Orbilia javanica TaxID=47235 RepID=A0AAN8MVG5_9PEZI